MPIINLKLEVVGNADKTASVIAQGKLAEAIKTVKDVKLIDISDDMTGAPRRKRRSKNAVAATTGAGAPPQTHSPSED